MFPQFPLPTNVPVSRVLLLANSFSLFFNNYLMVMPFTSMIWQMSWSLASRSSN